MNEFLGKTWRKRMIDQIVQSIPDNCETYVEPFGGTFNVSNYIPVNIVKVYNDINEYDFDIISDHRTNVDFEECIDRWNDRRTFFYLDPPYYGKEDWYGLEKFDKDFHIRLRDKVESIKGHFVLTYNSDPFITSLYKNFNIYPIKNTQEIIITDEE